MPIDWTTFENNLTSFFEEHRAEDEDDAAQFISDEYEVAIMQGQDADWGTQYLSGQIDLFRQQLALGFNSAKPMTTSNPTLLYQFVNAGILAFWPTVQFALTTTPALLAATVATLTTNSITAPGTLIPFTVQPNENARELANTLATSLQQHASTVVGQVIGVTSTAPPLPFTAPWTGVV